MPVPLGFDLAQLCIHGTSETLNRTENTQPAILAASIAIVLPLERRGLIAEAAAGHSLGEYTAITAAGGFELKDAIALVQKRGRYMQEAMPDGAGLMAAILGMDRTALEKTCLEAAKNGIVAPANYNSPGQIVIAGEKKAVEHAMELAKTAGAKKNCATHGKCSVPLLLDETGGRTSCPGVGQSNHQRSSHPHR